MRFLDDTRYPSLVEITDGYVSGSLRPSDVVKAHLDRIERWDPVIGAFQAVYAEEAMAQAEAADRMLATGARLGPFHGIPFGLKDICDVEGRVTTGGSMVFKDRISPTTGPLARRLFDAGGIMLGKTKTVEFALGGWGTNQKMGTPRNPWDMNVHRVPGGSSSGTAAGTAAGMIVCGVGTDTGGSVRLPAGYCGLVGLKVTEGQLPTEGILPLSDTLDTPGPLARSVEDTLLMYLAMKGAEGWHVERDRRQGTGTFAALQRGVRGLRLGVLDADERSACSGDVLHAYDAALDKLRHAGAELVVFSAAQPYADLTSSCGLLIVAEGYFHRGHLYEQDDLPLDEDVRLRMLMGRDVTAVDYIRLLKDRVAGRDEYLRRMTGLDALLTPTMATTAPPVDTVDQSVAPGHFTRHVNYFGMCALSVPSGLASDGLPTSLQVIARPNDEITALRIGAAYEALQPSPPVPTLS
ncbi:amidase [Tateyamaria pelophila]|uniref:amidase n=1 Tax=Tateyamaria pelophila TaxID=328415 RepID=UPI001CBE36D4|nr:amidase [Tateyamaria pelophila]